MINTLGAINHRFDVNGTKIIELTDIQVGLNNLRNIVINQNRKKDNTIALLPYIGVRGTYTPSDTFFIDIDTTEGVDELIEGKSKLFAAVPNIIFIQKSFSGKLHICLTHKEKYDNPEDWKYYTKIETLAAVELIRKEFGIDYYNHENGIDTHSFNWTALLYVSPYEFHFNPYCTPISLSKKNIQSLENKYSELFESYNYGDSPIKTDITGKYVDGNVDERLCVDRNCHVGEYNGNELRWRIARIAFEVWGDNESAKKWCDKHFYFEGSKSIYSKTNPDKPINHTVLQWLITEGYLNVKEVEQKRQTTPNYHEVMMGDGQWMSDYTEMIADKIVEEKVVTIDAPTGAGKTTMIKKLSTQLKKKGYREVVVLVPFNVTNHLYEELNIVSSETDNEYKKGGVNVMVWDQFYKRRLEINPDVILVDESHTLFTDRNYRDSAINVYNAFNTFVLDEKHRLVFISATPAGEVAQFNSYMMKFIQKEKRDIKIEVHFANDTGKCIMRDLRKGGYDHICVFSDKDAQLAYAQSIERGYDAIIYHSLYKNNVKQLREDELLHNRVVFLTCIAFNGLNIRNTQEKILIDMRWVVGETSLNEIIQVLGRFRNNKDITLRLYVDGKWQSQEDIDETFRVAKVIMESDSMEIKNDYWERMVREEVYNVRKELQEWDASQTIEYIIGSLTKLYGKEKMKLYKDESNDSFSHTNPLKKKASDAFKAYVMGSGEVDESNHFIQEFRRMADHISVEYGVDAYDFLKKLLGGKGSDRMIDTILGDLSGIMKIVSYSDEGWENEKQNRKTLIAAIKNEKVVKGVMSKFKVHDQWRKKYSGWQLNAVLDDQLDELWKMMDDHNSGRSRGGSATKKITDGSRVWDSCKDASMDLNCSMQTISKRIKKGLMWEC